MVEQSLIRRKLKSSIAKIFIGVIKRNAEGMPTVLLSPGSNGKRYQIIIRRFSKLNKVTLECRLETGAGYLGCPGNGRRKVRQQETICYHARAALDFAVEEKGLKAFWSQSEEKANKLANLGGKVFIVRSHQNSAIAWVVVK